MRYYLKDRLEQEIKNRGLLLPLDVLLVGATGVGKSSTLNALFGEVVAKVGEGVDPETQEISPYQAHDYLRFHDSAGLGDGRNADLEHEKNITEALLRTIRVSGKTYHFMDLVMVILDGGSRDLGTTFRLLETVVLKTIKPKRVIVAINQADAAMKGRGWNDALNRPDEELRLFLDEKVSSVQKRIKDSTGLSIAKPVCYSAYKGYNIDALMEHIVAHLPKKRRKVMAIRG